MSPKRHFRFSDEGITNEVVEARRPSSYFVPIPAPKKKAKQLAFDTEWTKDRVEENEFINQVRKRVAKWRQGGYVGITKTTRQLLDYWTNSDRQKKLFFCQIVALETAILLAEVASKYGDVWIDNKLRDENKRANSTLNRIAFKMATAAGKTVVMAMLPTTGEIRSSSTDDIACWFIDTDYNGESFFVRHAYFTGAEEPYDKLKRALRAEIDESAWSALYSTRSYPFERPETGKIAMEVINHYGDEVLKVYEV